MLIFKDVGNVFLIIKIVLSLSSILIPRQIIFESKVDLLINKIIIRNLIYHIFILYFNLY